MTIVYITNHRAKGIEWCAMHQYNKSNTYTIIIIHLILPRHTSTTHTINL